MEEEKARKIILNAVESTERTWMGFDEHWDDIEKVFLSRAYDQQGFDNWIFVDFLERYDIYSIKKIGKILDNTDFKKTYNRDFAGSLESPLYQDMKNGLHGTEGIGFYKSVKEFNGRKGRTYYQLLWYLLYTCHFLKEKYNASFSNYLKTKYTDFTGLEEISDEDFKKITINEWEEFLKKHPWDDLHGVGPNVFDYIMGDIVELGFVKNSYKLDSANERFLITTGVFPNIETGPEAVKDYLLSLNLDYTIREINKGLYTYTSDLGKDEYGFCRKKNKCSECDVEDICEKNFDEMKKITVPEETS